MEEVLTKKCISCEIIKSKTQFTKNKTRKDKLCVYCKLCCKNRNKIKRDLKIKKELSDQFIEGEEWRIIPDFLKYEASTLGKIRHYVYKTLLTTTTVGKNGYCRCKINGKTKSVHRLIASAFLENPEKKETVNHINYNRSDNRVENLEWMTQQEQVVHRNLRKKTPNKKENKPILKNLPNEKWKILKSYPIHKISVFGRIKNIKTGNISIGHKNGGYLSFTFKGKHKRMHRLVALTFLSKSNILQTQVNHIDGNKTNNKLSNLEWTTPSENICHAYNTGLNKSKRKIYQLTENNKIKNKWDSIKKAYTTLGINKSNISTALGGKYAGMTNGYYWCYAENYNEKKTYLGKTKRKIKQSDMETDKFIKTWDSIDEVAEYLSLKRNCTEKSIKTTISKCLGGYKKSYLKFKWEYCEN